MRIILVYGNNRYTCYFRTPKRYDRRICMHLIVAFHRRAWAGVSEWGHCLFSPDVFDIYLAVIAFFPQLDTLKHHSFSHFTEELLGQIENALVRL
ncbi:hypothetical protein LCGC14_0228710 [marine sediment metagenome]|uniref:Uncharacterized protein n=1 Tax=marine sediment metagenome TaxID=412755 RepID=A0A0F9USP9_9ZZZZ